MDQANDIAQAITDLPVAGMIPVGLALIAGLLLWAAGRRILLAAFAAIGFVLGGAAGWMIGELMGLGMQIWIPAVVGGIVFACVAALASRLVVAVAFALTLGIAAPLATMTLAQIGGSSDNQPAQAQIADSGDLIAQVPSGLARPDEITQWLNKQHPDRIAQTPSEARPAGPPLDPSLDSARDVAAESLGETLEIPEQAQRYVDHIRHIAGQLTGALKAKWATTPASSRPTVIASALSGLLVGMLLGALARGFSAVVVTAFSGSLLWLSCAWTLVSRAGLSEASWMPESSGSWLVWWMVTAVIGLAIQWTLRRRRADKSAD
ncbi:MAG: hypothetical protein V3T84_02565 [Phycisphaerales bacterium]